MRQSGSMIDEKSPSLTLNISMTRMLNWRTTQKFMWCVCVGLIFCVYVSPRRTAWPMITVHILIRRLGWRWMTGKFLWWIIRFLPPSLQATAETRTRNSNKKRFRRASDQHPLYTSWCLKNIKTSNIYLQTAIHSSPWARHSVPSNHVLNRFRG